MINKQAIEALDRMLQDVNDSKSPFGGKVIVFSGDFRQVLPVIPKSKRDDIINTSLVTSYLGPILIKMKLTENIRSRLDPKKKKKISDGNIKLPPHIVIPYEDDIVSL